MRYLTRSLLSLIILFVLCGTAWSQASVNVNPNDWVYRDIQKLVANGLVDKIIWGQRPFSRREVARITGDAIRSLPRLEDQLNDPNVSKKKKQKIANRLAYLRPIIERLIKRFKEELIQLDYLKGKKSWYSVHILDHTRLGTTIDDSLPRNIPANGLGGIDAVINPLLQYRQGRHVVDGANLALETESWLRATNHFALMSNSRIQLGLGRDGQPDIKGVFPLELYGKFFVKNFQVQIGRGHVIYGQGKDSGVLLSMNPRGLDMVNISNDIPFFFPSFLKYLGAQKLSFFYADLGPEQNFPHAYLVGYKWTLQPLSFFEIGFSNAVQSGGEGSPSASFGERVSDALPIMHVIAGSQEEIGNKIGGVDLRFRIPTLRFTEIYLEAMFDDADFAQPRKLLWQEAGYVFGVYLPRLANSGAVDLRLEWHHTGIRFYRHGQYTSGFTLNQFILGDDLGPDANGGYVWVNWDVDQNNLLTFTGAYERRSNDQYIALTDPFRFEKVKTLPKENRIRVTGSWEHRAQGVPIRFLVQLGYERVINFAFTGGQDLNNFLGRVGFDFYFGKHTSFPRQSSY